VRDLKAAARLLGLILTVLLGGPAGLMMADLRSEVTEMGTRP
jgi:hypothetical protein